MITLMKKISVQHISTLIIVLINLGTFFYVQPLSQNLSDLGNALDHRAYLILWGCSAALYFGVYTYQFMKKSNYTNRAGIVLLLVACLCMAISVIIPYMPEQMTELSKWHTRIAMIGTVVYILVVFHVLSDLLKTNTLLFYKVFPPYVIIVVMDLLLYLLVGGVSTLLETSFTIFMCFYLTFLIKKGKQV